MARVLVFCYLIALLVRPQDWFGPFIGLPTGFVITLAMFVGGLVNYLSDRSRYETPHNRLLPIYILVIFASTLINTDFGNAMDQAVTFGKGGQPNTLAFVGGNTVAWKRFEGDRWEFNELDGYETPIKDGYLHDVVSGDLNNDGRKDLVFLEVAKASLDLVTFEAPHHLVPANRWQVFEERTFRQRRGNDPEPREALVVDLTADGKNDLVVLVHDRILLYPQE